jgi:hypothetical protein
MLSKLDQIYMQIYEILQYQINISSSTIRYISIEYLSSIVVVDIPF